MSSKAFQELKWLNLSMTMAQETAAKDTHAGDLIQLDNNEEEDLMRFE